MSDEFNLSDLEYVKSGGPTEEEMDKLDGLRVKITDVTIVDDTTNITYDENNNQVFLPLGQELHVKKIQLTTESFGESQIGRPITHVEKYNLKEKNGKWTVSLHEKASTAKFLAKYKLDKFENAIGKEVVLSKKTNPETKRSRMSISI